MDTKRHTPNIGQKCEGPKNTKREEEEEEEEEPWTFDEPENTEELSNNMWLLGKLWTTKPYNTMAMIETMKKIWNPAKEVIGRDMGNNCVTFQFKSERDIRKVLEMEPWHFNKNVLVLKRLQKEEQPSEVKLNKTPFWIRLYDLPPVCRSEFAVKQIAGRIADEVVDIDKRTLEGLARSVRVRVNLDLSKALKRGTKIKNKEGKVCWIPVTYERLPNFCYGCGKIGHLHRDCLEVSDDEEEGWERKEDNLKFGDWMRASPMKGIPKTDTTKDQKRSEVGRALLQTETKAEGEKENQESTIENTNQVSELLKQFEKVEVEDKIQSKDQKEPEGKIDNEERKEFSQQQKEDTLHEATSGQLVMIQAQPLENMEQNAKEIIPTERLIEMLKQKSHIDSKLLPHAPLKEAKINQKNMKKWKRRAREAGQETREVHICSGKRKDERADIIMEESEQAYSMNKSTNNTEFPTVRAAKQPRREP